jgi:hypothetical protein
MDLPSDASDRGMRKDTELKVMFHEDSPDTIIQHEATGAARIESGVLEEELGAVLMGNPRRAALSLPHACCSLEG